MRDSIYHFVTNIIKEQLPEIIEESVRNVVGKKMYTTAEVRDQYGLSATKQHRMRKKGKVTYVQDGGTILYPRESIDQYVSEHTVSGEY